MRYQRTTSIVTPASAKGKLLASRETFKQGLGKKDSDQDEYIDFLIASKSSIFQKCCDRLLYRETVRDAFHSSEHGGPNFVAAGYAGRRGAVQSFLLSRYPVAAIASVTDASGVFDPSFYRVDGEAGILRFTGAGRWPDWSPSGLIVEYDGGWITPGQEGRDLPEDIEEAVLTLVRAAFKSRDRDPALRTQSAMAGNESYWIGIPPDVEEVARSYSDARGS